MPKGFIQQEIQYLSARYTKRLSEADFQAFAGNIGNSYYNAMAEMINGLFYEKFFVETPHGKR